MSSLKLSEMSDETEDFYKKWIKEASPQMKEKSEKIHEDKESTKD
jgi:hypothetical protein